MVGADDQAGGWHAGDGRSLVILTWDGGPLDHIRFDAEPAFDLLLFDFTGRAERPAGIPAFLSKRTECKGDVLRVVAHHLHEREAQPHYVALFDHDIRVRISDINRLLAIGHRERLDVFAPALSHDSHYSYARFLQRSGGDVRAVPWVEVMMPFYRTDLFLAAEPLYAGSVTAYGVDSFVLPLFQKALGMERVAVIDAVTVTHMNPVSSGNRRMSNGLTPYQERLAARRLCLEWLRTHRPNLIGTRWFYRTFAPWDGPARFWGLRLGWPWHWWTGRRA